jgi:PiT family inorganic phosphate transporter
MLIQVIIVVLIAFIFDFVNGFHDAANSIATVVSTRVLRPLQGVAWAAFFNFVAAVPGILLGKMPVATTIGKGIVATDYVTIHVVMAALVGAIVWDVITWYLGLPVSSSHALIGGLAGAGVAHAGLTCLEYGVLIKVCAFIVISPLVGLVLGVVFMNLVLNIFGRLSPTLINRYFRRLQLVSAALYSLGHGTNDAQKTMGIVAVTLFTTGFLGDKFYVPLWVILTAHAAMGLGTLAGGWRIIKTMGSRITRLQPISGFCAETAAAASLFGTALAGIPVSTTHTITGAIVGVGSVRRLTAVRWGVTIDVVWAWILTIPCAAAMGALMLYLLKLLGE